MNDKVLKACLFLDENGGTPSEEHRTQASGYAALRKWLTFYVSAFDFEVDIRPYQLTYRRFNAYMVDTGGYLPMSQHEYMTALGELVESRPSRLYLFWTGESWEAFCKTNPHLADYPGCINCCDCDSIDRAAKYLLDMAE